VTLVRHLHLFTARETQVDIDLEDAVSGFFLPLVSSQVA
jgi:hypothetical protein